MSFRREAHVPEGGPDGGDGGRGGDVIIQADRGTASLFAYRDHPHVKAKNGVNGAGKTALARLHAFISLRRVAIYSISSGKNCMNPVSNAA